MSRLHPVRLLLAGGAVVVAAVALALAVPAAGKPTAHETLSNFRISGDHHVRAGTVTLRVRNTAGIKHERVVIRTDRRAAALPTRSGEANEAGSVGEIELKGHAAGTLHLHLAKGHYALICNVPGHYMAGVHTDLTVG